MNFPLEPQHHDELIDDECFFSCILECGCIDGWMKNNSLTRHAGNILYFDRREMENSCIKTHLAIVYRG